MKIVAFMVFVVFQIDFTHTAECGWLGNIACGVRATFNLNISAVCKHLSIASDCLFENGCDFDKIHKLIVAALAGYNIARCEGPKTRAPKNNGATETANPSPVVTTSLATVCAILLLVIITAVIVIKRRKQQTAANSNHEMPNEVHNTKPAADNNQQISSYYLYHQNTEQGTDINQQISHEAAIDTRQIPVKTQYTELQNMNNLN
ncbi:hypothetical protein SNE40_022338 [Patella caerulea]|uniref:Extracellular membrane protein CFEM domain-containing protein n=1 Tax=Patella caerulea TaxID=87958 RepID=A0AAN8IUW2_PATCE